LPVNQVNSVAFGQLQTSPPIKLEKLFRANKKWALAHSSFPPMPVRARLQLTEQIRLQPRSYTHSNQDSITIDREQQF
jgi:hypothetical protein